MSSITPDAVREEITENALKEGNPIKTSTGAAAGTSEFLYNDSTGKLASGGTITASKTVYVNSSGVPTSGALPFELTISGVSGTQAAIFDLTAVSTLSADQILHETIVAGASTSLTTAGFLRVKITDTGDNLTDGFYYIPFGTLA